MIPFKPIPVLGLILAPAFFATGCAEDVVAKPEAASVSAPVIATPANAEGLRVLYGDELPDFSPRSKNFSDVVIRGKYDAGRLRDIRVVEAITKPGVIQYRVYNAGDAPVRLSGESSAFDPQGVLTYSQLTRFPARLNAKQAAFATIDLNKDDETRTNLTITLL